MLTSIFRPKPLRIAIVVLSGALVTLAVLPAMAQRPPKEEDPPVMVFRAEAGRAARGRGTATFSTHQPTAEEQQRMKAEMRRLQAMTPQQREQYFQAMQDKMEQRRENDLRAALAKVGVDDPAAQDAILAFIREQQELRAPLDEQRMKLAEALLDGTLTDTTATTQQKALNDAVEEARKKYEVALTALDAKVQFSKKPRLKALLATAGVLDDVEGFVMGPAGLEAVVPFKPMMPGMMEDEEE